MKSSIVTGLLASLQFAMLVVKGGCYILGQDLSWGIVLWPLWTLLLVAVGFWVVYGVIVAKAG